MLVFAGSITFLRRHSPGVAGIVLIRFQGSFSDPRLSGPPLVDECIIASCSGKSNIYGGEQSTGRRVFQRKLRGCGRYDSGLCGFGAHGADDPKNAGCGCVPQ